MALIGEKVASDATLDKVLCICSGRRPKETCTESLTYKGPSCGVVTAEASMDFGRELPSLFFGDTPLKDSGSTFLVEFPFVDLVSLRTLNDATCFILVLEELLSS